MSFIPQACTTPALPLDIDGSQGITITGAGTDADPYIISAKIDPVGGNALSVGPAGLKATGGGGGGGVTSEFLPSGNWGPILGGPTNHTSDDQRVTTQFPESVLSLANTQTFLVPTGWATMNVSLIYAAFFGFGGTVEIELSFYQDAPGAGIDNTLTLLPSVVDPAPGGLYNKTLLGSAIPCSANDLFTFRIQRNGNLDTYPLSISAVGIFIEKAS